MDTKPYIRTFDGNNAETAAFSQALVLIHTAQFQIISMGKTDVQMSVSVTRKGEIWTVEGGLYDLEGPQKEQPSSKVLSNKVLKMPSVKDGA